MIAPAAMLAVGTATRYLTGDAASQKEL